MDEIGKIKSEIYRLGILVGVFFTVSILCYSAWLKHTEVELVAELTGVDRCPVIFRGKNGVRYPSDKCRDFSAEFSFFGKNYVATVRAPDGLKKVERYKKVYFSAHRPGVTASFRPFMQRSLQYYILAFLLLLLSVYLIYRYWRLKKKYRNA